MSKHASDLMSLLVKGRTEYKVTYLDEVSQERTIHKSPPNPPLVNLANSSERAQRKQPHIPADRVYYWKK